MKLDDLRRGFREDYLDYEALTQQLTDWAEAFPSCARVESIGRTPQGREIWLFSVGPDAASVRPSVWVDGNMHGGEVSGSSVALAIAEAALRLHVDTEAPADLPDPLLDTLRAITFRICPRMSPDGAEAVLKHGGFVRSVPRTLREHRDEPHWRREDVDGDGVIRHMRVRDPAGEFVESRDSPNLMLPRRLQDPPPYYRIYPEGTICNWDGRSVPVPEYLSGTTDLNRNFPWSWAPEPEQPGAGLYPGSEAESRAVLDWTSRHPELFAWLNLHTFGGVFIRPLGEAPDARMDRSDFALYRQLQAWGDEFTGYPTVSGYEEFTYQPETPLHGDLLDYAYRQRGCLAEVCELWDLFRQAGLPEPRPFVHRYTATTRDDFRRLAQWDRDENRSRIFRPWREHDHPQLGRVEIGGADPRVGVWNPPFEQLPEVCDRLTRYWLHVAAMLPRIEIEDARCEPAATDVHRVTVVIANQGYLPTWGLDSSRDRPWNRGLYAQVHTEGCELVDPAAARIDVGHLHGWGRGLGQGADSPWFMRSQGSGNRHTLTCLVTGSGAVTVEIGGERTGRIVARLAVGA